MNTKSLELELSKILLSQGYHTLLLYHLIMNLSIFGYLLYLHSISGFNVFLFWLRPSFMNSTMKLTIYLCLLPHLQLLCALHLLLFFIYIIHIVDKFLNNQKIIVFRVLFLWHMQFYLLLSQVNGRIKYNLISILCFSLEYFYSYHQLFYNMMD